MWTKPCHLGQDFLQCHLANQLSLVYISSKEFSECSLSLQCRRGLHIAILELRSAGL